MYATTKCWFSVKKDPAVSSTFYSVAPFTNLPTFLFICLLVVYLFEIFCENNSTNIKLSKSKLSHFLLLLIFRWIKNDHDEKGLIYHVVSKKSFLQQGLIETWLLAPGSSIIFNKVCENTWTHRRVSSETITPIPIRARADIYLSDVQAACLHHKVPITLISCFS